MESHNDQPVTIRKKRIKTCDIIVPTFHREHSLKKALQALHSQLIPDRWTVRIIVCDDGSSPSTQGVVDEFAWGGPWDAPIILTLSHVGRAGARNAGIASSNAEIILFLADDILLRPGALAAHLEFHQRSQEKYSAALGFVLWDPRICPTPFMEWMTHGGQQNNYDALLGEEICDGGSFFYGSHISVKRALLEENTFSELFTQYGWEDLELGSRLQEQGMALHVLHTASALHNHRYGAQELLARQRTIGAQKYRVNTNSARIVRHALYQLSGIRWLLLHLMKILGNKLNIPPLFQFIIAGEFWYGVHHANTLLKRKSKEIA